MRYLILILVLNYLGTQVKAQTTYFADSTVWTLQSTCAVPFPCVATEVYNYYINGDSLLNGAVYKKISKKGAGSFNWFSPFPAPSNCLGNYIFNNPGQIEAFVRQSGKQIRMWDMGNGTDVLLYDFDLQIGDTLPLTANNFNPDITVSAIDSFIVNGQYRKRFTLQNSASQFLAEGIGHIQGFLEYFPPIFDCGYNLTCYSVNDVAYYPTSGPSCNIAIGIPKKPIEKKLELFPNPVNEYLFFDLADSEKISEVSIFDLSGKKISGFISDHSKIHVESLFPGLYFLIIKTDQNMHRTRFIKN